MASLISLYLHLIARLHILSYIKVVIIHIFLINPVLRMKIHSLLIYSVPNKSYKPVIAERNQFHG